MTLQVDGRLVLVGAGKMGGAMLSGWLDRGVTPEQVAVLDPAPPTESADMIGAAGVALNPDITTISDAAVLVLAVKPQMMDQVLPDVIPLGASGPVVLSIAAGRTIASFESVFGPGTAVVRAMPNTPAAIGRGITVACPNGGVTDAQRSMCDSLLQAVGEVAWVDDESLIDAVTAVSGGGPAYVFLLTECMARAAVEAGLSEDLAMQLARVTVSGAGELMRQSPLEASTLRENVTSPGGTTAEALKVLMADGALPDLMIKAVAAATARSKELAG